MATRNILILTVLISLATYDAIQAEIIREMDIPNLNVTRALGMWYAILGPGETSQITCATVTVEQLSGGNVTLTANVTEIPGVSGTRYSVANEPTFAPMNCAMKEGSNILACSNIREFSMAMVVFDIVYDSYMAVYITETIERITRGTHGFIYILSRQLALPDTIIDKVKQSNIFRQSSYPHNNYILLSSNSGCGQ